MYEKVLEVIKNSSYEIFGIRHIASDESYKVGDCARNSYDWDIENDVSSYETDSRELDGTSAYFTDIDTLDDEEEIEKKIAHCIRKKQSLFRNCHSSWRG